MIEVIAAVSTNRIIGRAGALPWHLPHDLRRFRDLTMGRAVIMGRSTWDSLPDKVRPLPGRRNLVLTNRPITNANGAVETFTSLPDALLACNYDGVVIGGESVFAEALTVADTVHITAVDAEVDGDAKFPPLPVRFNLTDVEGPFAEGEWTYWFRTYERGDLYLLAAARSEEQRRYMQGLQDRGICIFCPEHVAAHHREPIEFAGKHWYVTRNGFPYAGTADHFLIVPHAHVTSFEELPDEAGAELWSIRRRLAGLLGPVATATVERSGNMHYNGGSVAHFHVHFVTLNDQPEPPVRFRVSGHQAHPL